MSKSHKSNSLAEISTIFGMTLLLTLFGVFVYFMVSANKKSSEIKEQLSIDILFHESVDESTVKMMEKKLKSMNGVVKNALYVSKDDAQKLMMKHVGEDAFEILDGVNPLPSSIHVNLTSDYVNPDSAKHFSSALLKGNQHIISEIAYNESQFLEIGNVFKNFRLIMIFIATVLLIIAILLIYNTIRLAVFSKRFMIRTMQLVGAKSYFIRRPFIFRAFYQGLISGVLAILFLISLWYSFTYINPNIIISLSSNSSALNKEILDFTIVSSGILVAGILISVISTYFALNKFIWVKSEKLY
ncbi:MAG: permease-like cell division protein FtsX [Flavobacteriales bacterium]|jgi:cell division transport system permease protein|nr:permease-like cell division protein FtsX [Flavobacteriales bacterium]MDG1798277.1 permease-like cell division protein FtsX [Flavobacteriales bacterium]